jgi:hypothetical protein
LKYGDGRKVLVAVGCSSFRRAPPFQEGRAPFKKGAPLSERARPYCLLEWQGAQAPSGGLVISSSSLMQLRVDEKIDPLAVIQQSCTSHFKGWLVHAGFFFCVVYADRIRS